MRPVLHGIWTSEVANLRKWSPPDPDVVDQIVCIDIGPGSQSKGSDVFTIVVATPRGLQNRAVHNGVLLAGRAVVMPSYDFDVLWDWLQRTVESCAADSWPQAVERLRHWFHWEYDGLQSSR